jgi:hypothetical protein
MKPLLILTLLTLTACGADGAPDRPSPGVKVSGEASMGLTSAPAE